MRRCKRSRLASFERVCLWNFGHAILEEGEVCRGLLDWGSGIVVERGWETRTASSTGVEAEIRELQVINA